MQGRLKHRGYVVWNDPDAPRQERDVLSCHHCQAQILMEPGPPRNDLFGVCWQCDKVICPPCAQRRTCDPWERKLERSEARGRLLKAVLG